MSEHIVYCADVGAPAKGNYGWVKIPLEGDPTVRVESTSLDQLSAEICADLDQGNLIALGFECPLWLSLPIRSEDLCKGRQPDGNRSAFAPAGAWVALAGLQSMTWLFSQVRKHRPDIDLVYDPAQWGLPNRPLLVWEAFVSGDAHAEKGTI